LLRQQDAAALEQSPRCDAALGIPAFGDMEAYALVAYGHLAAAYCVLSGEADHEVRVAGSRTGG
jgi:hypothetical protein